jgi:hypothetical protein
MDPTTQRMMMSSTGGQLGIEWEDKSIHLSDGAGGIVGNLTDVDLCGGVFIAVGTSATLLRSTDGIAWTKVSPPIGTSATTSFTAIAYNPTLGRIVVTSTDGVIYSDNGGVSWTTALSGFRLNDVAFGNSRFVAVGGNGSGTSYIYYSTNGTSWTSATPPAGVVENLIGVAYGTPSSVAGGRWVAIGNGTSSAGARYIFSNDTGVTWTNITLTTTDEVNGITYAGGSINLYVVSGSTISSGAPFVRTSAAGNAAFPTVYTNTAQIGTRVTITLEYLNSTLVLLGFNNQVVTSTNGTTWTVAQAEMTSDSDAYGITYSSGLSRYVFVGRSSTTFSGDLLAATSGASLWYSSSLLRSGATYVYDGTPLYGAVYVPSLNKYFVSGNGGKIFSSTDFSNWTGKYLSQPIDIKAFFFDGTRIIAGGTGAGSNYIFSSTDGTTWTQNYSGGTPQSMVGGFYGGYFASTTTHVIYGGENTGTGKLWYSSNGTSWSTMTPSSSIYYSGLYTNDPNVAPLAFFGSRESFSVSPTGLKIDLATDPASSVGFFETIPAANTGGALTSGTSLKVTGIAYVQEQNIGDTKIVYLVNRIASSVPTPYVVSTTAYSYVYANGNTGSASQLNAVTIAPPSGTLVAVGGQTVSGYSIPYIQTSADSLTWTQRVTPGSTTYRSALLGVVYTNNRYIAVGVNGVVLVSQL